MNGDLDGQLSGSVRAWKQYPAYKGVGIDSFGLLPEHWELKRLLHLTQTDRPVMYGIVLPGPNVADGVPIVKGGDVAPGRLRLDQLNRTTREIESGYARSRLRGGDIVYSIRGSIGQAELVPLEIEGANLTQDAARIAPKAHLNPLWLLFALKSHPVFAQLDARATGATIRGINIRDLKRACVPVPPPSEQSAIARFLQRETAKLDILIAKKERLIELLQEKRTALISHAVTKGLEPAVPMKASGVAWLGQIPAHWKIIQSRRVFQVRNQPAAAGDEQLTASQKYGMIPQTEFMELEGRRVVATIKGADSLRHVEPNDFVISLRSFQGGIEWCKLRGSVTFHYVVLRPVKAIHPPYFAHLFKSSVFIQALRATTDFIRDGQDLRYSHFILVPLPVVPLDEQVAIANYLDRETAAVSALIAKVQEAIDKLREYRTALISATVTGKIDVSSEEVAVAVAEPTVSTEKPAAKPVSPYFRRTVFAAEIIDRLCDEPTFGHVKFQKCLFVAQHHLRVGDFEESYKRMAAGPYDNRLVRSVDSQLEKGRWFKAERAGDRYAYHRLDKAGGHRKYFDRYFGEHAEPLARLLDLFRPMTTDQAEIVATLYAVWNDFLLRGEPCDDDRIVAEVLTNWHDRKKRFEDDRWRRALGWMRENGLVPTGFGTPTVPGDGGTA